MKESLIARGRRAPRPVTRAYARVQVNTGTVRSIWLHVCLCIMHAQELLEAYNEFKVLEGLGMRRLIVSIIPLMIDISARDSRGWCARNIPPYAWSLVRIIIDLFLLVVIIVLALPTAVIGHARPQPEAG